MSGTVAIVDYGSGNLRSAAKAFERVAGELGSGQTVAVTADPAEIASAERIVLPGVGAFADCRAGLDRVPGLLAALTRAVIGEKRPFLGICVGMQLLADRGLEHGSHPGLAWIPGEVVRLPDSPGLKVPHMGWNTLTPTAAGTGHPLLAGIPADAQVYFVHSYRFAAADPAQVLAVTEYGGPVAALIGRGNVAGTQFHPEKSQKVGLMVIANFLRWSPVP